MKLVAQRDNRDCVLACLAMVDNVKYETVRRSAMRATKGKRWHPFLSGAKGNHLKRLSKVRAPWLLKCLINSDGNPITTKKVPNVLAGRPIKNPNLRGQGILNIGFSNTHSHAVAFHNGKIYDPGAGGKTYPSLAAYLNAWSGSWVIAVARKPRKAPRRPQVQRKPTR